MAKNFEFKRMRINEFELFFDVDERQAYRKKAEMLQELGLKKGDPIFFPDFCRCVKRTEEELKRLFGW